MQTIKTYRTLNDYRICPEPLNSGGHASNSNKVKGALLVALMLGVGSYVYSVANLHQAAPVQATVNQTAVQAAPTTVGEPEAAQNAVAQAPAAATAPDAAELRAAQSVETTPNMASDKTAATLNKTASAQSVATAASEKTKLARATRNVDVQTHSQVQAQPMADAAQSSPEAAGATVEPAVPMAINPASEQSAPMAAEPPAASEPAPVANVGDGTSSPAG